jgi:hypothetical protein
LAYRCIGGCAWFAFSGQCNSTLQSPRQGLQGRLSGLIVDVISTNPLIPTAEQGLARAVLNEELATLSVVCDVHGLLSVLPRTIAWHGCIVALFCLCQLLLLDCYKLLQLPVADTLMCTILHSLQYLASVLCRHLHHPTHLLKY